MRYEAVEPDRSPEMLARFQRSSDFTVQVSWFGACTAVMGF